MVRFAFVAQLPASSDVPGGEILDFYQIVLNSVLRGFWSHYRVVSKSISSHSFDFFEKFFSGINRPEHSAKKVYRWLWPVNCPVARPFRVKSAF